MVRILRGIGCQHYQDVNFRILLRIPTGLGAEEDDLA